ncbi:hypothetical protein [Olivibacter sp. XZL3]|uniref:hypothetical protein n=1 Tax=Olivibacter sp. XZL3 TaxID=1735116 RepID=UPI0010658655|nr:hypothetical protein [Olivibacter sp. XZL3]
MQVNSFILLLFLGIFGYPPYCYTQNLPPNQVTFTQDSIVTYLKRAHTDPMTVILKSYEASGYNYLVPYYLSIESKADSTNKPLYFAHRTMLTTFSSFVGDVKNNEMSYMDSRHWETDILEDADYTALNAVDEITRIARGRQVIMLNESHTDPRGRLFLSNLLPVLKAEGFAYLFIEGLHEENIDKRGFPLQTSGFYTSEPMFGNLIRKAIQLGFKLIPYDCNETPCNTIAEREQHHATTIYETLKNDPKAKAIVFAGHGHINKDPEKNWMAYRFKTLSGIDPFCINQSINSEAPQLFHHLRQRINQPVIYKNLKKDAYREFSKLNLVDATIVFPNTNWIDNRYATWLLHSGGIPCTLRLADKKYDQTLLSVFECNEFDQFGALAVPVLNMVLQETTDQKIFLDKGSYYIRVVDLYGQEIHKEKITL